MKAAVAQAIELTLQEATEKAELMASVNSRGNFTEAVEIDKQSILDLKDSLTKRLTT